ncbi:MAG: SRPBCC domain-containing protein [Planctomycetota bacterium]
MRQTKLRTSAFAAAGLFAIGALGLGIASRTESIDTTLFNVYTSDTRTIEATVIVAAEPDAVFERLTTLDGLQRWLSIEAEIDLTVGGVYEWYFEPRATLGSRGTEGSQVLGFAPGRMLCVAWNAPPELRQVRGARTWVTFLLEPVRGGTRATVVHTGFGDTPGWDRAHRYYEAGWPNVMTRLRQSFGAAAD